MRFLLAVLLSLAFVLASCGTDADTEGDAGSEPSAQERFPDVIDAAATQAANGTWTINATISSPYDSAERYADAWRVIAPDGSVLGIRELLHDHGDEQPFTRSLTGVEIPDGVVSVTIEGRDQRNGWGGERFELAL